MRLTITFLLAVSFTALSSNLVAQKLIALHHAGTASFYTTPLAAYNAAANGDTLYIPGGNFDGFVMQKSLTLIGAGHNPYHPISC